MLVPLIVSAALLDAPPYEPDIVAVVVDDTPLVDTLTVTLTEPAGTVALGGTLATVEPLHDKPTTAPPAGAGCDSISVAVEFPPPIIVEGFRLSDESTGGIVVTLTTVRAALLVTPLYKPEIVATDVLLFERVRIVKATWRLPAGTFTLAGTITSELFEDSVIVAPPDGALTVKTTVPVDVLPPLTLVGVTLSDDRVATAALAGR